MPEKIVHTIPCPVTDCAGDVKIPASLPAGEYACPCHAARLRLEWAVYLKEGRKPYLSISEKKN